MPGEEILLTPGPVTVSPAVREALARPVTVHYGPEWASLYRRVTDGLKPIFGTEGHVLLAFGPGMAALEMVIGSMLGPGDEVLVPRTGRFARRLEEVTVACRLRTRPVEVPALRPFEPDALERALRDHPSVRAVVLVHHETGLGMLNPIRELCAVAADRGVLTIVDAVSSLGGVELEMDGWGIDACVAVANKCLAAPIGVAPVALGARALAAIGDGRDKSAGWYLDVRRWLGSEAERPLHPHPTTMPTSIIVALDAALAEIAEVGLDAFRDRHRTAQQRVRAGLRRLGFELLVPDELASPVTTAVLAGGMVDVVDYIEWLRREHALHIAGGLDEMAATMFRVGHMGRAVGPDVVEAYLAATGDYLAAGRRPGP